MLIGSHGREGEREGGGGGCTSLDQKVVKVTYLIRLYTPQPLLNVLHTPSK